MGDSFLIANDVGIEKLDSSGQFMSPAFYSNVISNGNVFRQINNLSNVVYADGRFVVSTVNPLTNQDTTEFYFVHRLFANGLRDSTFKVSTDFPINRIRRFDPDEFYLGGFFSKVNARSITGLARLDSSGNLDTTFNMRLFPNSFALPAYRYADGRILVGGTMHFDSTGQYVVLARIFENGTLDSSFMVFRSHPQFAEPRDVYNVEPIEDGKFIVYGKFTNYNGYMVSSFAVIDSLGRVDTTLTPTNGFYIHPNLSSAPTIRLLKQVRPGVFIVYGNFSGYAGNFSRDRLILHRNVSSVKNVGNRFFSVKVHPNPSRGYYYFESQEEISEIKVMDTFGRTVLTSNSNEVDLSHCANGVYVFWMHSNSGKRSSGRLIKTN